MEKYLIFFRFLIIKLWISHFGIYVPRLFYLHGKAKTESDAVDREYNLIFDKYDYANLFSKDNEILNYLVIVLLRYGVLYVGFGLDDQTFDYMESRIKMICEKGGSEKIPTSYALLRSLEISKREKEALEKLFNINVIEYDDHNDLPLIVENVNNIIQYTKNLNIEWIENFDQQKEAVDSLKKSGIEEYLEGNLDSCKDYYEKALGHTLFWDVNRWENVRQICDLQKKIGINSFKNETSFTTKNFGFEN